MRKSRLAGKQRGGPAEAELADVDGPVGVVEGAVPVPAAVGEAA
jgi:hypothetical protein